MMQRILLRRLLWRRLKLMGLGKLFQFEPGPLVFELKRAVLFDGRISVRVLQDGRWFLRRKLEDIVGVLEVLVLGESSFGADCSLGRLLGMRMNVGFGPLVLFNEESGQADLVGTEA